MTILLELWVCKIGLLKTKEVSVLLSIVFVFYVALCLVCFFCLLFGCFVLGMEWMR